MDLPSVSQGSGSPSGSVTFSDGPGPPNSQLSFEFPPIPPSSQDVENTTDASTSQVNTHHLCHMVPLGWGESIDLLFLQRERVSIDEVVVVTMKPSLNGYV